MRHRSGSGFTAASRRQRQQRDTRRGLALFRHVARPQYAYGCSYEPPKLLTRQSPQRAPGIWTLLRSASPATHIPLDQANRGWLKQYRQPCNKVYMTVTQDAVHQKSSCGKSEVEPRCQKQCIYNTNLTKANRCLVGTRTHSFSARVHISSKPAPLPARRRAPWTPAAAGAALLVLLAQRITRTTQQLLTRASFAPLWRLLGRKCLRGAAIRLTGFRGPRAATPRTVSAGQRRPVASWRRPAPRPPRSPSARQRSTSPRPRLLSGPPCAGPRHGTSCACFPRVPAQRPRQRHAPVQDSVWFR